MASDLTTELGACAERKTIARVRTNDEDYDNESAYCLTSLYLTVGRVVRVRALPPVT